MRGIAFIKAAREGRNGFDGRYNTLMSDRSKAIDISSMNHADHGDPGFWRNLTVKLCIQLPEINAHMWSGTFRMQFGEPMLWGPAPPLGVQTLVATIQGAQSLQRLQ